MTPERYRQVKQVFQAVLERPPAQRRGYLDFVCARDAGLKKEVEVLLDTDEQSATTTFLETPAVTPVSKVLDSIPDETEAIPNRIGPYEVQRILGSGGMGTVVLAARADDQYKKQVAIKLVRSGLETDSIVQRFRRERQIVANLEHPNIARLIDGGATPDGRPYLVMEYVDGKAIDVYCDSKKLTTTERLRLFRTVCAAVHHAHQNLVVHRDLKPGNILVTNDGTIKLLDFGIAKILSKDPETQALDRTATSMRLMTPQYASPEQLRGDPVTTASDIYLLGIVLYELLTGHRPFQVKDGPSVDIARLIGKEADRPSTAVTRLVSPREPGTAAITPEALSASREGKPKRLRRRLEGDIDAMVLKAMRRDPAARYSSAELLSEDIRRHLEGEPVLARPSTMPYLARKFYGRNRAAALVAGLLVVSLVGGSIATAWQATVARRERERADRKFNEVRKVAHSFLFEVHDAIAPVPGTTKARRLLIDKALEYLNTIARESGADEGLEREIASAYHKVGDLQGNPNNANLGDTAGATISYKKALEIRERLAAASPGKEVHLELAQSLDAAGDVLHMAGDSRGALKRYREALDLREKNGAPPQELIASYDNLAGIYSETGKTAEALDLSKKAHALATAEYEKDPEKRQARRQLSVTLGHLGEALDRSGNTAGALENFRKALDLRRELAARDTADAAARRDLSFAYEDLGNALSHAGNTAEALRYYLDALRVRQDLAAADPLNTQAQRDVAYGYIHVGGPDGAKKAVEIFALIASRDPNNLIARRDLALAHERAGDVYLGANQTAAALNEYGLFESAAREWTSRDPESLFAGQMLAVANLKVSEALGKSGDRAKAVEKARVAVTLFENLRGKDKDNPRFHRGLALAHLAAGRALLESAASSANKKTVLTEAKSAFEKSAAILGQLQALPAADQQLGRDAAAAAKTCEEQIRNLGAVSL